MKLILTLVISCIISGCTIYETYRLKGLDIAIDNGEINIVVPYSYDEENFINYPASVQFWVRLRSEGDFEKLEVRDIILTGTRTGKIIESDVIFGKEPRVYSGGITQSVASLTLVFSEDDYEPLKLSARVIIHLESKSHNQEETVNVLLELKEGKEYHWNWFDRLMSV